jgi:hypothetical protein
VAEEGAEEASELALGITSSSSLCTMLVISSESLIQVICLSLSVKW